uniref:G protein-coupled receptor n=1 Tax=Heterorhabditis bacteriophora TaxID=37862 RepID=A0A1I7XP29_HETBA
MSCESLHEDLFDRFAIITHGFITCCGIINNMVTIVIPTVLLPILLMKNRLFDKIEAAGLGSTMAETHKQLLKAITVQSMLPLIFVFADLFYFISQLRIFSHPLLENVIFMGLDLIPTLTPLINIYIVQPYRIGLLRCFESAKVIPHFVVLTDSSRSDTEQQRSNQLAPRITST